MNKYLAHSENRKGEVQTMKQHSEGVAEMMRSFPWIKRMASPAIILVVGEIMLMPKVCHAHALP